MNTISCIVVDDEPLAVRLMESYVAKTPFLSLKGSFTSGTAAYSFLQDNPVDLLFCDIQMPNLSGMDLSRMLPERTRIIFTTAFSEYAVEGFKVRALDYLLKPISYEDFLSATVKAKEYFDKVLKSRGRETLEESGEQLTEDLLFEEREREFYGEGFTWFDMKKERKDIMTVSGKTLPGNVAATYTLTVPDEEWESRKNIEI